MSSRYSNYRRSGRRTGGFRSSRTRSFGFGNFNATRQRTYRTSRRTASYPSRPRFALSGYRKDTEKKYLDRALVALSEGQKVGGNGTGMAEGVMFKGIGWSPVNFRDKQGLDPNAVVGDLLKGLETGTTINTRIGNKITPRYLKGSITMTAAAYQTFADDPGEGTTGVQHGEQAVTNPGGELITQYMRTTYRVAIVKDLQVNSTATQVGWNEVFGPGANSSGSANNGITGGVHAELNLDNMGRFIVLFDKTFTVDADDPQVTCPFMISGSSIGEVRYNGPGQVAYTDKGIYIVWAAYTVGVSRDMTVENPNELPPDASIVVGGPVMNSRLCFVDS